MKRVFKVLAIVALAVAALLIAAALVTYFTLCTGHPHGMC